MAIVLVSAISILGIILSKFLFKKWINHLTTYCVIWSILIILYELKLLPYPDVIPRVWVIIILSFLSFLLGILTVISTRNIFYKDQTYNKQVYLSFPIFKDDGKAVKYSIIFFSVICLLAAIQNWMVLLKMFGSFTGVILNAGNIYALNLHGEIEGVIPYISYSGYVAIFFSAIYSAYRKRFSLLTFFPFLGIMLKELAIVGRTGMLFALLEFLFAFFLFRHLLNKDLLERFKFFKKNGIIAFSILIIFFISAISVVRVARGTSEKFANKSTQLRNLKNNLILTPTIYLYLSSDLGVLSQYLRSEGKLYSETEYTMFGQNTFLPIYSLLAKFKAIDRVPGYPQGYFIPMWTNSGTYLRELHADFGNTGILLGPYLIGLIITWLWFKFYRERNLIVFALLVYLNLILGFSFLVMVTRFLYWIISLLIIIFCIPILEKIAGSINKKPSQVLT